MRYSGLERDEMIARVHVRDLKEELCSAGTVANYPSGFVDTFRQLRMVLKTCPTLSGCSWFKVFFFL